MQLNSRNTWREFNLNNTYEFCTTYPNVLVVPAQMSDTVCPPHVVRGFFSPSFRLTCRCVHSSKCAVLQVSAVVNASLRSHGCTLAITRLCGVPVSPWYRRFRLLRASGVSDACAACCYSGWRRRKLLPRRRRNAHEDSSRICGFCG